MIKKQQCGWILFSLRVLTVHLSLSGVWIVGKRREKEKAPIPPPVGDALPTSASGPAHVPKLLSHACDAVIMIYDFLGFSLFVIFGKVFFFFFFLPFAFGTFCLHEVRYKLYNH